MAFGYDLFRLLDDGGLVWVGAVATLDDVAKELKALGASKPGRYFVRDAVTGKIVRQSDSGCVDKASA